MKTLVPMVMREAGLEGVDTAVERFSARHSGATTTGQPGSIYEDLIPLSAPVAGEQYAFEVDLDRCTGCKACVVACHSMNGLGETEWWREAGTLAGETDGEGWMQTITSACHHCLDPGCAEGCPVGAYEKDATTGVVRHLDDQCIGCRYCEMKCPYGVPKYHAELGIVRKCDLCVGRLSVGEAPACVQACPGGAIRVRKVKVAEVRSEDAAGRMVPTAFPSGYTRPTTRYVSGKSVPLEAREFGSGEALAESAHYPLVWMLALTQWACGLEGVALGMGVLGQEVAAVWNGRMAAVLLLLGVGGSVLHLGRPLGAWRFFLGLGTSWMSREILAFNVAIPVVLGVAWMGPGWAWAGWGRALGGLLLGVAVWTSVMIYGDTRRPGWEGRGVALEFLGSGVLAGVVLGLSGSACGAGGAGGAGVGGGWAICGALLLLMAGCLWRGASLLPVEVRRFRARLFPRAAALERLWGVASVGVWLGAVGMAGTAWEGVLWAVLGLMVVAFSLWRRFLFFVGTPAPRMPRGVGRC